MSDSLIVESQKVREQMLKELGGLDGLCDKLEEMDRERTQKDAERQTRENRKNTQGKPRRSNPERGTAAH